MGRCIRHTEQTRWAKHRVGSFPGAACYQPIELPPYKAAPVQGGGLTISPCPLGGRTKRYRAGPTTKDSKVPSKVPNRLDYTESRPH
jgi:hypothetical protein